MMISAKDLIYGFATFYLLLAMSVIVIIFSAAEKELLMDMI